ALATLAAGSAIPVDLQVHVPVRPTQAIETIAYFCAAELLANAAKQSSATRIGVRVTGPEDTLVVVVSDDGPDGGEHAPGGRGGGQRAGRPGAAGRRGGRAPGHREPAGRPDPGHRRAAAARVSP